MATKNISCGVTVKEKTISQVKREWANSLRSLSLGQVVVKEMAQPPPPPPFSPTFYTQSPIRCEYCISFYIYIKKKERPISVSSSCFLRFEVEISWKVTSIGVPCKFLSTVSWTFKEWGTGYKVSVTIIITFAELNTVVWISNALNIKRPT